MLKELSIEEKYARYFEGVLKFDTLVAAEETITTLDRLYRQFVSEKDPQGAAYCKQIARLGKQRAYAISKNARVSMEKRSEKEEIAQWFTVWLQTPDLFFDWLHLRKQSEEFIRKFAY